MTATLTEYNKLVKERPAKFDTDEVRYRDAEGKERCGRCLHLYLRHLDKFGVCEIFRNDSTDDDGIDPDYVCDFFTRDGDNFPLLKDKPYAD